MTTCDSSSCPQLSCQSGFEVSTHSSIHDSVEEHSRRSLTGIRNAEVDFGQVLAEGRSLGERLNQQRESLCGNDPQGAQPPASYRLPFRSRETDGCGLIQAVPETNHDPCYRRNPLSPVKHAAVSDSNECSATYCRRALTNSRMSRAFL